MNQTSLLISDEATNHVGYLSCPNRMLPHSSSSALFERVDVEVDRTVERCQQVTYAGDVRKPDRPLKLRLRIDKWLDMVSSK